MQDSPGYNRKPLQTRPYKAQTVLNTKHRIQLQTGSITMALKNVPLIIYVLLITHKYQIWTFLITSI